VTGDVSKGFNCVTCEVRKFCHQGCNAANIKFMDNRAIALPMYCTLSKIGIRVGLEILSEISALKLQDGNSKAGCGCK
jgi:sulfatase maturation enzyme AslB (radical SAM superfamily)